VSARDRVIADIGNQDLPQMNADNRRDPVIEKTTVRRSVSSHPE
jgi:hypothetical protein